MAWPIFLLELSLIPDGNLCSTCGHTVAEGHATGDGMSAPDEVLPVAKYSRVRYAGSCPM